ncbi:hypothetical protein OG524_28805 [Streptomyces sp. NBC_01520]|uniref:hypothetical protein n=1 Tax=Streptomyces sp. NBC_01520 TaxID=2903892 RepID=UPI0038684552
MKPRERPVRAVFGAYLDPGLSGLPRPPTLSYEVDAAGRLAARTDALGGPLCVTR